jgi:hypothetical protein
MINTPTLNTKNRAVEINSVFDDFVKDLSVKPKIASNELATDENKRKTFENFDTSCALSIIRAIAATAKEVIYLFTDNLDPQVYDDPILCDSLKQFTQNGGKVFVLIDNKLKFSTHNPAPVIYNFYGQSNFIFEFTSKQTNFKNFIVADEVMYRLEIEPDLHRAIASFNDKEFADALTSAFMKLSNRKR